MEQQHCLHAKEALEQEMLVKERLKDQTIYYKCQFLGAADKT
jgi:hypothetical protein